MNWDAKSRTVRSIAGLIASVSLSTATSAQAEIFKGYPDAIICRGGDVRAVGYIAQLRDDGSAVYSALGDAYATVTPDGVFHREGAKDCDGKTLEQLQQDGQTR